MAYGVHTIKNIPVTSSFPANGHKPSDRMKSRRKAMALLVFVVVVTIVLLTSAISDATFNSSSRHRWQVNVLHKTSENIRNAILFRQYLFPIRIKSVTPTNSTILELKNATISGLTVQKFQERKRKLTSRLDDIQSAAEVAQLQQDNRKLQGLQHPDKRLFDDPLVIERVVDSTLKRVPFLEDGEERRLWNGRDLQKEFHGQPFIQDEQYFYLQHQIQSGGLNISRLSEFSLADRMSPWEWDLYSQPPLKNVSTLGSEDHSRVILVCPPSGPFKVGDQISVRVDVFDEAGRPKREGGDEVRVWLREDSINAGAGFNVTDLRNGSYLATGKLLWPGNPEIRASLTYPKEIVRSVFYLRNMMKGLRLNAGGFRSKKASEASICSPFPFSGVYRYLCNLTSLNYGLSWYCGMPSHPSLTCRHWSQIRDLDFPDPLPINAEERKWFDRLNLGKKHHLRSINQSVITLKVSPSTVPIIHAALPCNRRPPEDTWGDAAPRGFIHRDQWIPLACSLPAIDVNFVNQCLKGSTLYMVGDSNLRHMLEMMAFLRLCAPTRPLLGRKNWHKPQTCINHEYYYLVKWRTHALPFHTNNDHWARPTNQQAVGLTLDSIPSTGRYLVLLHMYLHFTTHHYSVYRDRIRSMRDAVARLLRRNPATKVVIRGPHVAYKGWNPALGGDLQAPLYLDILKEEFRPLYNRVYLLNFWDFSIAAESRDFHPEGKVTQEMLRTFFGYVCN